MVSTTCFPDAVQQRQELLPFAEARRKYLWTWLSFTSDLSELPFTAVEGALGCTQEGSEGYRLPKKASSKYQLPVIQEESLLRTSLLTQLLCFQSAWRASKWEVG